MVVRKRQKGGKVLTDISTKGLVAFNCGFSCYRADIEVGEVRRLVETWGTGNMSAEEVDAYRELLPATFWVQFTRGWDAARNGEQVPEVLRTGADQMAATFRASAQEVKDRFQ